MEIIFFSISYDVDYRAEILTGLAYSIKITSLGLIFFSLWYTGTVYSTIGLSNVCPTEMALDLDCLSLTI